MRNVLRNVLKCIEMLVLSFYTVAQEISAMETEKQELLSAVANDMPDEMQVILKRSGDVLESIGSALHVAAMYGAVECTKRLLSEACELDIEDKDGHTPLHYAAVEGDCEVIRLLISARANLQRTTRDLRCRLMNGGLTIDMAGGRNALHLAVENGNVGAVEVLHEALPDLASRADLDGALPCQLSQKPNILELLGPAEPWCPQEAAKRRRRRLDLLEQEERCQRPVEAGYEPRRHRLYELNDVKPCLDPLLVPVLEDKESFLKLCDEITPGVFAFQLFPAAETLNQELLDELGDIESWAARSSWKLCRPNSMNRSLL